METKNVKVSGFFFIDEPLTTVDKIENGIEGYVSDNNILLIKKDEKTFIRIQEKGEIWKNRRYESLIHIKKENDKINIKLIYDGVLKFDEDNNVKDWSDPIEVECVDIKNTNVDLSEENEERDIEDLEDMHTAFVDYCWDPRTKKEKAKEFFLIMKGCIHEKVNEAELDRIGLIYQDCEIEIANIMDKGESFERRTGKNLLQTVPQINYLYDYLQYMMLLTGNEIKGKKTEEDPYKKMEEKELLKLFQTEEDPIKKAKIGDELSKRYE